MNTPLQEAKFLLGWSKGKPIVRLQEGSTFHSAGKWMTKLDKQQIAGMVAEGLATYSERGVLALNKEKIIALAGKPKRQGRIET